MIISNNSLKFFDVLPSDLIVRINVAWCNDIKELTAIVENATHPIYLDHPLNRLKHPLPKIDIRDTIKLANKNYRIQYFAFSNAESPDEIQKIRQLVDKRIKMIPKIETKLGVENMVEICNACETDTIMLDGEDLYSNVGGKNKDYNEYINLVMETGKNYNIKVLKLQGVIFDETKS